MRTRNSSEFYQSLQRYIFITPGAEINSETNLPFDENDYCVVDIDDVCTVGNPINDYGKDMELWAVLEPGETVPM
jgi:hypothetical protein